MQDSRVERYFFVAVFLFIILLAGAIVYPYLGALVFAGVIAVLVHPVHLRIERRVHHKTLSALLTAFLSALIIILPAVGVSYLVFVEVQGMSVAMQRSGLTSIHSIFAPLTDHINHALPSGLTINLEEVVREGAMWISSHIGALFTSTAGMVLRLFVAFIALYYFLKDGHRFRKVFVRFSPLSDEADEEVLKRLDQVVHSLIRGTLLIAVLQGALTGIALWAVGIPNPALWGVVATIGAIIPNVGTGIVFVPAALFLIVTGQYAVTVLLALWGFLVVGLIDNIFRPQLIGRDVSIHPLLVFLSVLGGLAFFGASGFLIGPLVFGVLVALADIYANKMHIERSVLHDGEPNALEVERKADT